MSGRRGSALGAVLVATIVLGGCGGGAKGPPKVASKADFVKAGDAICIDRDRRSSQLIKDLGANGELARLSSELADIYADAIASLQALPLPPGTARAGAQKYVASVVAQRRSVQRMKAAATQLDVAVRSKQVPAVKAASQQLQIDVNTVQALGNVADLNARTYGFRKCGAQSLGSNPVA
ncbi:MAG: hypothetical protein QOJ35_398 [Solirubrobacteraceae bacterium]|nr:hypothetical protein [Solirubrobacteraceae bacterium]